MYLKEIQEESLLTAAEECSLAERDRAGRQCRSIADDSSQLASGGKDRA